MLPGHLPVLEDAISDVGYWRWWDEALPDIFQVEFGGVQLYFPSAAADQPPSSVVALRFFEPLLVAFLTQPGTQGPPSDWRLALPEDRIAPFALDHERFTLSSEETCREVASDCLIEYLHGSDIATTTDGPSVLLAFRAQGVGLVVRAKRMVVVAQPGELDSAQVHKASDEWWDYWREYWRRRDSDAPLPRDYACEVTIPIE